LLDLTVYLVSLAIVLAGVGVTLWRPPERSARRKLGWMALFGFLGLASLLLWLTQGARDDRDRAAQQSASEKLQAESRSRIDALRAQNDELLKARADLKAQNRALREKIKTELPPPRRLSPQQEATIVSALRSHTATVVVRYAKTLESQEYARQLSEALSKGGWILGSPRFAAKETDAPGLFVVVKDERNPPRGALTLVQGLRRAGVPVSRLTDKENMEPLTLYVGIQSAAAKNANPASP
jgi:glycine/D-amino acid oxidase-like deaminating enzyme